MPKAERHLEACARIRHHQLGIHRLVQRREYLVAGEPAHVREEIPVERASDDGGCEEGAARSVVDPRQTPSNQLAERVR